MGCSINNIVNNCTEIFIGVFCPLFISTIFSLLQSQRPLEMIMWLCSQPRSLNYNITRTFSAFTPIVLFIWLNTSLKIVNIPIKKDDRFYSCAFTSLKRVYRGCFIIKFSEDTFKKFFELKNTFILILSEKSVF